MSITTMIAKAGQTLELERPDNTQRDALGARKPRWDTVASGVACWMQPTSATIREDYSRRQMAVTHRVFVEQDLECQEGDRITIGEVVLNVHGFIDEAGLGQFWRIDAEEIR